MSDNTQVTDSPTHIGQVKWFNNRAGYGFITCNASDGAGDDIFVHHSAIKVKNEQFKYLVQGEYVSFKKEKTQDNQQHEYCAGDVSGVNGGTLMCETRNAARAASGRASSENGAPSDFSSARSRIRVRGPGPREGEEWMLVKRKKNPTSGARREGSRPRTDGDE